MHHPGQYKHRRECLAFGRSCKVEILPEEQAEVARSLEAAFVTANMGGGAPITYTFSDGWGCSHCPKQCRTLFAVQDHLADE